MSSMKGFDVSVNGAIQGHYGPLVSSPEHEVLKMSYCDHAVSVVRQSECVVCHSSSTFQLVYALEATFLSDTHET